MQEILHGCFRCRICGPLASSHSFERLSSAATGRRAGEQTLIGAPAKIRSRRWHACRHGIMRPRPTRSRVLATCPERPSSPTRRQAGAAQTAALRDTWSALWRSRLLVWVVGVSAAALVGSRPARDELDPAGLTRGLGRCWGTARRTGRALGRGLASHDREARLRARPRCAHRRPRGVFPHVSDRDQDRWPRRDTPRRRGGDRVTRRVAASLYGIHRLTTLEFAGAAASDPHRPEQIARLAVFVVAFAPMAVFFSAIYTESVFLSFSVALFWFAGRTPRPLDVGGRGGRARHRHPEPWRRAARSRARALSVRPREDRPPTIRPASTTESAGGVAARSRRAAANLRPRYRLRRDVLWLALFPVGSRRTAAGSRYQEGNCWLRSARAGGLGPTLVGPLVGLWDGARTTFEGLGHCSRTNTHTSLRSPSCSSRSRRSSGSSPTAARIRALCTRLDRGRGLLSRSRGPPVPVAAAVPPHLVPALDVAGGVARQHPRIRVPLLVLSALLMAFSTQPGSQPGDGLPERQRPDSRTAKPRGGQAPLRFTQSRRSDPTWASRPGRRGQH